MLPSAMTPKVRRPITLMSSGTGTTIAAHDEALAPSCTRSAGCWLGGWVGSEEAVSLTLTTRSYALFGFLFSPTGPYVPIS
jgi:hypothetical protein